uniref:CCR4-NOT transcription complex subunit 3 isoform X2 n=1 Tax=Rhizophora mucronata TaxID=61149 RepID=A0A2P2PM88_RHIMU
MIKTAKKGKKIRLEVTEEFDNGSKPQATGRDRSRAKKGAGRRRRFR